MVAGAPVVSGRYCRTDTDQLNKIQSGDYLIKLNS